MDRSNDPLLARKAREGLEREGRKPPLSQAPGSVKCPECGCDKGHRISCNTGNERATAYQRALHKAYLSKKSPNAAGETQPRKPRT